MPEKDTVSNQQQLSLLDDPPSIESILARREDQWFDRKSIRIEALGLAKSMIALANADGGRIVVGINNGEIEGIDSHISHVNDLLQAAIDHTVPPVRHTHHFVDCVDKDQKANRLVVFDVEASEQIHRNRKGECYLRVGDEDRKLGPQEERELAFDKGESIYDSTLVPDLIRDDIDIDAVDAYRQMIGATSNESLLRSRGLYLDRPHRTGVTQAGWLLFGHEPPIWSYVRYLRYSGVRAETGTRSNVTDDIHLDGTIPSLINQARELMLSKMLTVIRLLPTGRFDRVPILPEFAWLEAIVNAVTHRSYSLQGDGVRIIEFNDRIQVESPGRLPGLVRVQNIRHSRYSRNPHIARVLAEMTGFVRELNEGVPRMFDEMERYGLPDPLYTVGDSNVCVTLFKYPEATAQNYETRLAAVLAPLRMSMGEQTLEKLLRTLKAKGSMPPREVASLLTVSPTTARRYMRTLEDAGLVTMKAQSSKDPHSRWTITDAPFWQRED